MGKKSDHPLYHTWVGMINRCKYPSMYAYKNYGGRGISVCQRWIDSFESFASDMGDKPLGFTLDRIDTNGNYEPANCKWSSPSEQARNMRTARRVTIDGIEYHVADLQDKYGVSMRTIYYRAKKGWSLDKVVSKEKLWNNAESQKNAVITHALLKKSTTHCKRGHEFNLENTYFIKGRRVCRTCKRAHDKMVYYKHSAPIEAYL